MCKEKCCGGSMCMLAKIGKYLLIIGGLNWGLIGAAMLMDKGADWNVVHMVLSGMPTLHLEGLVYLLVGIAAVMKIFGCRCSKCTSGVCTSCGTE